MSDLIQAIAIYAIPVIFAITLHEAAHGYVARMLGDPTAQQAGRITLNPMRHIDPVGTLLVPVGILLMSKLMGGPAMLFGWAKPVPVDFSALRHPKRDMIWVAAAGPAMNILLALLSGLGLAALVLLKVNAPAWLALLLVSSVEINLVLAVLNLWPIPPLDGSKIAVGLLPPVLAVPLWRASRYGMIFLVVIFILAPMAGIDVFGWMIGKPVAFLERGLLGFLRPGTA
jgi:Zn-dependent protease